MPKLPRDISGQEVCAALLKIGFQLTRQRGSHMILFRSVPRARIVVPDHRVMRVGTLRQIITDAGLTVQEFIKLL